MDDPADRTSSPPLDHERLTRLVIFEYRALVVRRLGVTAEWRTLDWTSAGACVDQPDVTEATCRRCPVVAECLAAALATDDQSEWRGLLNRMDREYLWSGLERTYREVRDFELMKLDVSSLVARSPETSEPAQ